MPLVAIPNGIALVSDPTTWKISVGGKVYLFEWHHCCGPTAVSRRTHDPLPKQPIPFLEAASRWHKQGRKVDEKTGLCIYK